MPFNWWRRWKEKQQERKRKREIDPKTLLAILKPDMPDFLNAQCETIFRDEARLGLLVRDVPTLAEGLLGHPVVPDAFRITFPFALVVIDLESGLPERVVALERGAQDSLFLCMYAGGAHINFGDGEAYLERDAFLSRALELIEKIEGVDESRKTEATTEA